MTAPHRAGRNAARPYLCVVAMGAALAASLVPAPVAANAPWTSLFPERIDDLRRCDDFSASVLAFDLDRLVGFQLQVRFNPTVVDFVAAEVAPWLATAWQGHTSLPPTVSDDNVMYAAAATESDTPAPSGDGELALIHFRAIEGGTSDLDLHSVLLVDADFTSTPVTSTGSIAIIQPVDGPGCFPTPTFTPTPETTSTATTTPTMEGPSPTGTPPTATATPTASSSPPTTTPGETPTPTATEPSSTPTETPVSPTPTEAAPGETASPSPSPTPAGGSTIFLPAAHTQR